MHVLSSRILIGDFIGVPVHSLKISSSWKNLTDVAEIYLPKKLSWQGQSVRDVIRVGDQVSIQIGYDGQYYEEFSGFVAKVYNQTPIRIDCEDEMWSLKQVKVNKSYPGSMTLQQMLDDMLPNVNKVVEEIYCGAFRINNSTAAKFLQELRKNGIFSYFRDGVLNVGFAYSLTNSAPAYDFYFNDKNFNQTRGAIIENRLEFKRADDQRIKVHAVSFYPNGTKLEIDEGDEDGDTRTIHAYNLDEASLRKFAQEKIKLLKYNGYTGVIPSFGFPRVRHGDLINLNNDEELDAISTYFVDKVDIDFGAETGYKRNLELGRKL